MSVDIGNWERDFFGEGCCVHMSPHPFPRAGGSPPFDSKPPEGSFRDMEIFEVYVWLADGRYRGLQADPPPRKLERIRDWSVSPGRVVKLSLSSAGCGISARYMLPVSQMCKGRVQAGLTKPLDRHRLNARA